MALCGICYDDIIILHSERLLRTVISQAYNNQGGQVLRTKRCNHWSAGPGGTLLLGKCCTLWNPTTSSGKRQDPDYVLRPHPRGLLEEGTVALARPSGRRPRAHTATAWSTMVSKWPFGGARHRHRI